LDAAVYRTQTTASTRTDAFFSATAGYFAATRLDAPSAPAAAASA
jgi:hypothetical protein